MNMADDAGGNGASGVGMHAARWQLFVSIAAVVIAVAGALFTLVIDINTLSNNASNLADRVVRLESELIATQDRRAELTAQIAELRRSLVEIETQFCAEDSMRNVIHAHDLRNFSVLWLKVMGTELPISNAYYPKIGRCDGASQ